jgi:geranylgeranyl diphosphate synthase type II
MTQNSLMTKTVLINQRLDQLILQKGLLADAIRYALLGPGKRIRPLLVLASAETFGIDLKDALDAACAIEMVHTFSLIHDDLPCMDDDDFRRGRKAVHRAFPEPIALLAGDSLLSEAFLVLARSEASDRAKVLLIETLSQRVGKDGMTGGQSLDMHPEGTSLENLLDMQKKKTGDLLSCSLEFGPILAGVEEKWQQEMRSIGQLLGLAYQIRDDLEDAAQMSDEKKPTSFSLLGGQAAGELLEQCLEQIGIGLAQLPCKAPAISALLHPLFSNTRVYTPSTSNAPKRKPNKSL